MRHFLANVATYTIAAMLLVGAALFAWMRSAQLVITDEAAVLARYEPTPAHEFRWEELGSDSYVRNCANCHGTEGEGWDQYPGLGHSASLFAAPGGRDHLVDVHLYGLASPRWRAPMPPMGHMHDAELAAVINHVLTRFGNRGRLPADARLYVPSDVASRRGLGLSPGEVEAARPPVPGGGGGGR
jgi:mono/diheme cytochrome c family protein